MCMCVCVSVCGIIGFSSFLCIISIMVVPPSLPLPMPPPHYIKSIDSFSNILLNVVFLRSHFSRFLSLSLTRPSSAFFNLCFSYKFRHLARLFHFFHIDAIFIPRRRCYRLFLRSFGLRTLSHTHTHH